MNITKMKQTHEFKEQASDYQREQKTRDANSQGTSHDKDKEGQNFI